MCRLYDNNKPTGRNPYYMLALYIFFFTTYIMQLAISLLFVLYNVNYFQKTDDVPVFCFCLLTMLIVFCL